MKFRLPAALLYAEGSADRLRHIPARSSRLRIRTKLTGSRACHPGAVRGSGHHQGDRLRGRCNQWGASCRHESGVGCGTLIRHTESTSSFAIVSSRIGRKPYYVGDSDSTYLAQTSRYGYAGLYNARISAALHADHFHKERDIQDHALGYGVKWGNTRQSTRKRFGERDCTNVSTFNTATSWITSCS